MPSRDGRDNRDMIEESTGLATFNGNGSTTAFTATDIRVDDEADCTVHYIGYAGAAPVLLTLNTHYTVSDLSDDLGVTITYPAPSSPAPYNNTMALGESLIFKRDPVQDQGVKLRNQRGRVPEEVEYSGLDRLTMMVQALNESVDRCYKVPIGDAGPADAVEVPPVVSQDPHRDLLHQVIVDAASAFVTLGAPATSAPWRNLYDEVQLEIYGLVGDTTNNYIKFQFGDVNVMTWISSGYQISCMSERVGVFTSTTAKWAHNNWTTVFLGSPVAGFKMPANGGDPNKTLDGHYRITTGLRPRISGESLYFSTGNLETRTEVFGHRTSANINANSCRVIANVGNITGGMFMLYGVRR